MSETEKEYPLYVKLPAILIGLIAAVFILYMLSEILIPVAFAVLVAILLNPLYSKLEAVMPKVPAILLTLLVALGILGGLFYFLSTQIGMFTESIPLLKQKSAMLLQQLER
ncbi:MAG TPA: AI-2E family transporter, partial [Flavisolibacter sp.]|nr:AI-2E family transporter [Flavisolibacter sp.]